jgi:O-antigen/teichoic acid export membrane protein
MTRIGLKQQLFGTIKDVATGSTNIGVVIRSAASVMTFRVAGAGITYISQVLLAHWLGSFEYGIFAYAWVWLVMLSFLTPLGLNSSVVRFIPEYLSKQRWGQVRGLVYRSRRIAMIASLVLVGILGLSIFLSRELIPDYYIYPLYVALACIPLFALLDLYEGMARGFGWVNLAYAPTYIIRPTLFIIAMGMLFYTAVPLNGTITLVVAFITVSLTISAQSVLFGRRLRITVHEARTVYDSRYWMRASLPFMLFELSHIVLTNTDMIMLGAYAEPDEIAIYFASIRTAILIGFIEFAVSAMAVPKFAALHANGAREDLQDLLSSVVRWIFWPSFTLAILFLVFGKPILSLFGSAFITGYPVLALLILAYVVRAATGPIDQLLNMTGNQKTTAWVVACTAVLNIVLNAVMIPMFGLIGAATATVMSILISRIWLLIIVRHRLGLNTLVFSRQKQLSAVAGDSEQS